MSSLTIDTNPPITRGFTFDVDLLPDDAEGQALAQRIYDLIVPYGELTQRRRETDILAYGSQHEALVQERRKLAERETELAEEQTTLSAEALEIDNAIRQAMFNLKVIRGNPPKAMWSTKADWDAHNASVANAAKVLEEAQVTQQEHNRTVADWAERWNETQDSIKNLAESVGKVWVRLQASKGSRAFAYDPETGLRQ